MSQLVLCVSLAFALRMAACVCSVDYADQAILSALLPLHSGANCSQTQLRGLQQLAAIESTINKVNAETKTDTVTIKLQVFDTCSTKDGAVKASLKALVAAQQTCLEPPLFLGFIGPEEKAVLNAVQAVTNVFNATHVLPYTLNPVKDGSDENIFHVTTRHARDMAQGITVVVRKLGWSSFSLIFEESYETTLQAEQLLHLTHRDPNLCVLGGVAKINNVADIKRVFQTPFLSDGVVTIVDDGEMGAAVLTEWAQMEVKQPMILASNKVGLQTWQIPTFTNMTIVIIQETTLSPTVDLAETINSSLYSELLTQRDEQYRLANCQHTDAVLNCMHNGLAQDTLLDSLDSSVTALSHAVNLYSAGLRVAQRVKCRGGGETTVNSGPCARLRSISQQEWRTFLTRANTFAKSADSNALPRRLRFQMEIETLANVYLSDGSSPTRLIGQLHNGKALQLTGDITLPVLERDEDANNTTIPPSCSGPKMSVIEPPTLAANPAASQPELVYTNNEYSLYEMIGFLAGAGLGFFAFLVLIISFVYKNMIFRGNRSSVRSSPTHSPRTNRRRKDSIRSSRHSNMSC